jgi:hypothetical protein
VTTAELTRKVARRPNATVDDLVDALYIIARDAIRRGESRDSVYDALKGFQKNASEQGQKVRRKAASEVLACFDGYCSAGAAL